MRIKNRKSEQGFALALALMMLLVMSIMGASLMQVVSNDHKSNGLKDNSQQAFYAAETGIREAKRWMLAQSNLTPGNAPNVKFCKTSFFSDLSSAKTINNYVETKTLDQLITASSDETNRLKEYSYEYFITYTPDTNGQTSTATTKTVSGASGGDISESSSYKSGTTGTATYYTIYSCGCNAPAAQCTAGENIVTALESYVSKVN
ncbi:PilX N-terminal domain-containing pilus assembly protein [bacterium]|nr:PilX N-terminal domain-containing pilus assembly protein [bacterium]